MNYNPKVSLFEDEALPFLKAGWRNDWDYNYFLSVLQEYFQVERLLEDYVVLGVEMMEFSDKRKCKVSTKKLPIKILFEKKS